MPAQSAASSASTISTLLGWVLVATRCGAGPDYLLDTSVYAGAAVAAVWTQALGPIAMLDIEIATAGRQPLKPVVEG